MSGFGLVVGINVFDPAAYGGQDLTLAGCVPDAALMARTLRSLGYQDVTVLTDDLATRANFLGELVRIAAAAKAGDQVAVTLSMHGALIPDADRDESVMPRLGRDTAMCFHDGMIPDDAIGRILATFAEGVEVAILADLCHSQDVARFVCTEFDVPRNRIRAARGRAVTEAAKDQLFLNLRRPGRAEDIDAAVALLAACRKDQYAGDLGTGGVFTTGLSLSLPLAGSWDELRDLVDKRTPESQEPCLSFYGEASDAFRAGSVPLRLRSTAATKE